MAETVFGRPWFLLRNNPTMKMDTVRDLTVNADGQAYFDDASHAVMSLAYLSGFGNEEPFPLNKDGVPWIEAYLKQRVRPLVETWSEHSEVRETVDRAFQKQVATRLDIATTAFKYCVCNEVGGLWEPLKEGLHPKIIVPNWGPFNAYGKVSRFAHLGDEDSLVSALAFLVNAPRNRALFDAVVPQIVEIAQMRGIVYEGFRHYADEAGNLDAIALLDADFKEVALFELQSLAGMQKGALL